MDPYKTRDIYFDFRHSQFQKSLSLKHRNIKDKRIILFMKHLYLKKIVNMFQISIIFASTIITYFESMKPHIFANNPDKKTQIISICLSTYIAISTAVFKFIKIDDRKEEIYKMLQHFNDVETMLNRKIKELGLIQSHFDDEMLFYNKNHILEEEDEDSQDENKNHIIEDNEDLMKKKEILQKYYTLFEDEILNYERDETEQKILDAKKDFHTMFSYNEIIYYKGKIVESMLLEKVHIGNRSILEAPMEEYKNHFKMIEKYKNDKNLTTVVDEIRSIEEDIHRLKQSSNQIYNEDEFLYGNSWFNNLCLYFSLSCHFCLVMNLYLSLAIKRSKFRSLKKRFDLESQTNEEVLQFKCCRFRAFDEFVDFWNCQKICCCSNEQVDMSNNTIYYCCEC